MKPALTPEEWSGEDRTVLGTTSPKLGYFVEVDKDADADGLSVFVVGPMDFVLPPADRHALAALCLYGQPFGFTLDDIDALDWLILMTKDMMSPDETSKAANFRARLRALLPPETN